MKYQTMQRLISKNKVRIKSPILDSLNLQLIDCRFKELNITQLKIIKNEKGNYYDG